MHTLLCIMIVHVKKMPVLLFCVPILFGPKCKKCLEQDFHRQVS